RQWEVTRTNPAYIPLGMKQFPVYVDLNFYSNNTNYNPILKLSDRHWGLPLSMEKCFTYHLTIEKMYATLQCKEGQQSIKEIIPVNETSIIYIHSEQADFITSVLYGATPLTSPAPSTEAFSDHITNCPSCEAWINGFIVEAVVIFVAILVAIVLLEKRYNCCGLKSKIEKCIPNEKNKTDVERNCGDHSGNEEETDQLNQ
ncbi:unnamed protein product, partial [Meganyctiphanes norvegica]